jgi:YNFM family putative membrane transporter
VEARGSCPLWRTCGWIHPPLHWRYAFVSAAIMLLLALLVAVLRLPKDQETAAGEVDDLGFVALLSRWELVRLYAVAFGAFWVFSATFPRSRGLYVRTVFLC